MAQLHMSPFHNGWYDTRSSRPFPAEIQQTCFYYAAPDAFNRPPPPLWFNAPCVRPPNSPLNPFPQLPPSPSSSPAPRPKSPPTLDPKRRPLLSPSPPHLPVPKLRSILKHPVPRPGTAPRLQPKKYVKFTSSTTTPLPAAPGTYKHVGRSGAWPRYARHPAHGHPCLTPVLSQAARERLPTSLPDFFSGNKGAPGLVQQGHHQTCDGEVQRQRQQQQQTIAARMPGSSSSKRRLRALPLKTEASARDVSYCSSDSEDGGGGTDAEMAKRIERVKLITTKAQRESMRSFAREWDQRNKQV